MTDQHGGAKRPEAPTGAPYELGMTRAARRADRAAKAAASRDTNGAEAPADAGKMDRTAAPSPKVAKSSKKPAASAGKKAGKRSKPAKRRRRGDILHSVFYRVYFAVVLLCLAGVATGMHALKDRLADYELAQPSHVVEDAVKLFEARDYASIYDYDTRSAELGDRALYAQRMSELARGSQISWTPGYSSSDGERVYDVRLDGERFAQLTLTPSGETTRHGDRFWRLDSITTYVDLQELEPEPDDVPEPAGTARPVGRITVPSISTVTVDGATLGAAEAVRTDIPAVAEELLPEGIDMPLLTEYEFTLENEAPQLRVIDENGAEQEVRSVGENSWSCGLSEDAALKEKFSKSAVTMAQGIARCAARTVNKRDLLRYCVKDSPAYRFIGSFDDAVGLLNRKFEFENVEVTDFHAYSDHFFSCHVSFDYLNYFSANNVKRDPTSITLYCAYKDDSGRLYSFTMY